MSTKKYEWRAYWRLNKDWHNCVTTCFVLLSLCVLTLCQVYKDINTAVTYFSGSFLLRTEVVQNMSGMRAISNSHSYLHCWYWFPPGRLEERTAWGKVTLEPKLPLQTIFSKASLTDNGGRNSETQTEAKSAQLSSPRPDLDFKDHWKPFQKLTPIRSLSVVGLICKQPYLKYI